MKEFQREALLDRVNRDGATVGVDLPDTVEIAGNAVPVRDQVMALQQKESLSPTAEAQHESLTISLRRAKRNRLQTVRTESITYEEGEAIAAEVIRIDRALESLRGVGNSTDIEAEMKEQSIADAARWRHFVKRAARSDRKRGMQR